MAKEITYEEAVKRLEEIVTLLEKNEATLDESMKLLKREQSLLLYAIKSLMMQNRKLQLSIRNKNG